MPPASKKSAASSSSSSVAATLAKGTPRSSKAPLLTATTQQTRFYSPGVGENSPVPGLDLKQLSVSLGVLDLITPPSTLTLKPGTIYALLGRNGTGKSTLFAAMDEGLIPGLPGERVILLSQVEEASREAGEGPAIDKDETDLLNFIKFHSSGSMGIGEDALSELKIGDGADGKEKKRTVLDHVVQGDKKREALLHEVELLNFTLSLPTPELTHLSLLSLELTKLKEKLFLAQKEALRRSGTRGKDARDFLLKVEEEVIKAKALIEDSKATFLPSFLRPPGSSPVTVPTLADMHAKVSSRIEDVHAELDFIDAPSMAKRAVKTLMSLGFDDDMINQKSYSELSGGWKSRCSLAVSLLVRCDILLLDEPNNFLDLPSTLALTSLLRTPNTSNLDRIIILTSHDRTFLDETVDETIHLKDKVLKYFPGNPSEMDKVFKRTRNKAIRDQELLDKKKAHIEHSIKEGRASAKKTGDENRMRMVKSRERKLEDRWGIEKSAKGTRFMKSRDLNAYEFTQRQQVVVEALEPDVKITVPSPEPLRTQGELIHLENVSVGYTKGKNILTGVHLGIGQGERVGLVGANGEGKSTLAQLLLQKLKPSAGSITFHPLLTIGYFSQHSVEELSTLPVEATALSYFREKIPDASDRDARACLGSFGLGGKIASDRSISVLSGGQKVRLALALIVFNPPSLLLLDEVTTHVDAPTIIALAKALQKYKGAIVLVTHDRWFCRAVIEPEVVKKEARLEAGSDDEYISSSSDDEDDDGEVSIKIKAAKNGKTYMVGKGKVTLLEKGMNQYVEKVEKRLAKKQKEMGGF